MNSIAIESECKSKRFVSAIETAHIMQASIHFIFMVGEHIKKIDMTMVEVIVILCRMAWCGFEHGIVCKECVQCESGATVRIYTIVLCIIRNQNKYNTKKSASKILFQKNNNTINDFPFGLRVEVDVVVAVAVAVVVVVCFSSIEICSSVFSLLPCIYIMINRIR